MYRYTFAIVAVALLISACYLGRASAGDAEDIVGLWEGFNAEDDELYSVEVGADGSLYVEVYGVEEGRYQVDEEEHQLGWVEEYLGEEGELEWTGYVLKGDRLVVMMEDEELPFARVSAPEKPAHALVGRWEMIMEEFEKLEELKEAGEEIPAAFIVELRNDGTGRAMELSQVIEGTITLDPEAGTVELAWENEVESGGYTLEGDTFTIIPPEDKPMVFTRVK